MKKIICVLAAMALSASMYADSFSSLWRQVTTAQQKDLPKTELKWLDQIVKKARQEKAYGQLLKAKWMEVDAQCNIAPDSLDVMRQRLEADYNQVSDPTLQAVYAAALGKAYQNIPSKDGQAKRKLWYSKALADPALLARHKSEEYQPAISEGADSKIFYGDLLHVIGLEAKDYTTLHNFYVKQGNRPAACLTALWMQQQKGQQNDCALRKSKCVQSLDSLINVYQDLRECGEIAIARYQAMSQTSDATAEHRVNFINYALSRWGDWQRMNVLRNALEELQAPSFSINAGDGVLLPNQERLVRINSIRNINTLTLKVFRLNLNGDTRLHPSNRHDYERIAKLIFPGEIQSVTRQYYGQPAWKENTDSIRLKALPVGVYLLEASTSNNNIDPQRTLLRVSDLCVIHQPQPGKTIRFVTVNATTGKPVSGAQLRFYSNEGNSQKLMQTLTTDRNGEAFLHYGDKRPNYYVATTDDDKSQPIQYVFDNFYYWNNKRQHRNISIFTDRSIYRPGQTLHATALAYDVNDSTMKSIAADNKTITLTLRDANGKEVNQQKVTTDDFGTAAADFVLPRNGLTGQFSLIATADNSSMGYASVHVEQYKRPTFHIDFDKYAQTYQAGDTVRVKGVAKTYSGVAVQGGKVVYTVHRTPMIWWYRNANSETTLLTDSTVTASDGSFTVRLPMIYPDDIDLNQKWGYYITAEAKVTSPSGETQEGSTNLPLTNRSAILSSTLPKQCLRDSLKTFMFSCKNMNGEAVKADVSYRFDNGAWENAATNTPIYIYRKLISGKHRLEAICQGDTIKSDIIVFTYSDHRPATTTSNWYYLSSHQFSEGNPIYLQVGTSDKDVHVFYTVFASGKIIKQGQGLLSDEVKTHKIQYKADYGDGLSLALAWVKNGKCYTHYDFISRPEPDKHLNLTWKTFRDRLVPGQKETWTLQVTNAKAKPVKAQLLAAMYDKSLDAIYPHQWNFSIGFASSSMSAQWNAPLRPAVGLYGYQNYRSYNTRDLAFSHFDTALEDIFNPYRRAGEVLTLANVKMRSSRMQLAAAPMGQVKFAKNNAVDMDAANKENSIIGYAPDAKEEGDNTANNNGMHASLRENLNETAFFFPQLATNDNGDVSLRFTLPESVTTWKLMTLAHDKEMNYGQRTDEVIAQKTVMVQPNLPRFIRIGDKAEATAFIANTSDRRASGHARLELLDPETEKVLAQWDKPFNVEAGKTATVTFAFSGSQLPAEARHEGLVIARVTADGKGFSDGEQHYMAVMPTQEYVCNTRSFTLRKAGVQTIDLGSLFPKNAKNSKLTVEYTGNPTWLMIQALPTVANPDSRDALSLAAALYANTIARNLINANPSIGQTLKLWQQETDKEPTLTSNLQTNEELKNLALSETPWVTNAESETAQKQLLINYLDTTQVDYRLQNFTDQLSKLQLSDGSFSWWPGMPGNVYMTMSVAEMLTRLSTMTTTTAEIKTMVTRTFPFLDKYIAEEVAELKKAEKKGSKRLAPSETACHYLYTCALAQRPRTTDMNYLVGLLQKMPTALTIYGKAGAAVILTQYGQNQRAKEYIQSLKEYTVYKEEMGRYFDTPRAQYSWCDYRIPSQVAAIEALKRLLPSDTTTIEEMQRWLLQEKRTTAWSTPINTVNAVYAFLTNNEGKARLSLLLPQAQQTIFSLDGQTLTMPKATAAIGYTKTTINKAGTSKTLTIDKPTSDTSWGALYAQYWQSATDIEATGTGMTVKREILHEGKTTKVGDKVCVRITITADRDYDFVAVQDKRAACLQPVSQLSVYRGNYYMAPQDNVTNYYFNKLSKGKHVIETEYYIDRAGTYTTGTCTVQCAYSPAFSARDKAQKIVSEQ